MIITPSWVDELIEWDRGAGLTIHQLNPRHTICIVPRGQDTANKRTVRRHEFLHAKYDGAMLGSKLAHSNHAMQAVADVFVHTVYWPKAEKSEEADRDAAAMALEDLQRMANDQARRSTWIPSLTHLITMRSLSILDTVGSESEQWRGETMAEQIVGVGAVAKLREIIQIVRDKEDRNRAEEMFDELLKQQELPKAA